MDMLVEVNRRVAEEFESRSGKYKQIPEPVCRLRKKLYFHPKKVANHVYCYRCNLNHLKCHLKIMPHFWLTCSSTLTQASGSRVKLHKIMAN